MKQNPGNSPVSEHIRYNIVISTVITK